MMTHVGGIVTDFALSFQRVLRTLSWLAYSQVVQVNNTKIIPKTNIAKHNKILINNTNNQNELIPRQKIKTNTKIQF